MLKVTFCNMSIKRYKVEPGVAAGEVLELIYSAVLEGMSAAIPAASLDFMFGSSLCVPEADGEFGGCFIFDESCADCNCTFFERCISFFMIICLLPVYLLIALVILIVDGAPVVFCQRRFGLNNSSFKIFKFRTMVIRSETLDQRMQHRWGRKGRLFKMTNDPRATKLGFILRSSFLDELPQLFNVIKGNMCLIGARPLPLSDEHHYISACQRLRLRCMPGITGLWQVSGRNQLSFDQMCLLDYYYRCNRSLSMDAKIMLCTLKMLFS